jgi:hypothetical protein
MGLFQPSSRQAIATHAHAAGDRCPLCEQPIAQEVARKIEARKREQEQAAREKARAEMTAAADARVAAARSEGMKAGEGAALAKLADIQSRLAQAEQAKTSAHEQMAALKAAQEAAVSQRVVEIQEALQKERDAAVMAEKARAFDETQKLQGKLQDLQRQLEGKSAHELGEGSEIDLFEQLRTAFEGDRIRRVGKGVNGADVIHEVVHNGRVCGKIIYDAKNRNAWQNEFATKLRADKLAEKADHAVLSSNKFPKGTQQLHNQDGVIVASPARVLALAEILRRNIVQTHELRISNEAREHKTEALYAFITSERCKQLLDSIEAQAGKMVELDTAEEKAHKLTWDRRSKLIQAVKKGQADLSFEIDRILGTAGNGPEDAAA